MAPAAPPHIDSARVVGRRAIRFRTLDDVLADAERIAAADRAGTLQRLGNWSPGMVFAHVANWASYPFDGYPESLRKPPWLVRVLLRRRKDRFIHGALPAGARIPRVPGGTVGADDVSTDDGLRRLRAALARLKAFRPPTDSPVFGP
jgi:hypothetical protein